MARIEVTPLRDDLPFGARITGVTKGILEDLAVRRQLNEVFHERGMIVFEEVEPCSHLQVALSKVFGPLKDHPIPAVPRAIEDLAPGVIDVMSGPGYGAIVEIGGRQYASWLPWHFDHCYNNELNRAGVLRCVKPTAEGGLTGFADGIDLYRRLSPQLRAQIENASIIYTMDMGLADMRFGVPEGFREVVQHPGLKGTLEHAKTVPRSMHPAVWTRATGEKVLHISPWMACGIEGRENPEGDALLEGVCREMIANIRPYHHKWRATDMLIWDNWRMLHSVTGHDPTETRCIHRTTIKGDYGLGRFENSAQGRYEVLERTV
jgi:taurine dioxygenase